MGPLGIRLWASIGPLFDLLVPEQGVLRCALSPNTRIGMATLLLDLSVPGERILLRSPSLGRQTGMPPSFPDLLPQQAIMRLALPFSPRQGMATLLSNLSATSIRPTTLEPRTGWTGSSFDPSTTMFRRPLALNSRTGNTLP